MSAAAKTYLGDLLKGFATFVGLLILTLALRRHGNIAGDLAIVTIVAVAAKIGWSANTSAWIRGLTFGAGVSVPLWLLLLLATFASGRRMSPWSWLFSSLALVISAAAAQVALGVRNNQRTLAFAVVAGTLTLTATSWKLFPRFMEKEQMAHIGTLLNKPLPHLALTDIEGKTFAVDPLAGHVTVVNFWGTWCSSCVSEMPELEHIAKEYGTDQRVKFVLINSELSGDNPDKIHHFIQNRQLSIPVALDPSQAFYKLGMDTLPQTLVVDANTHIRFINSSFSDAAVMHQQLHSQIDSLLVSN